MSNASIKTTNDNTGYLQLHLYIRMPKRSLLQYSFTCISLTFLRLDVLSPTSAHECRRGQGRQGLTKEIQVFVTLHTFLIVQYRKYTLVIYNKVYLTMTITIIVQIKRLIHELLSLFGDSDTAEGAERMPDVRQASAVALTDNLSRLCYPTIKSNIIKC